MISATAIAGGCPLPPAGLTGFNDDLNGDGLDDSPRACFQLQDNTTGLISTYYFSSTAFQSTSAAFCGGAAVLDTVSPCSGDNSATISAKMGAAAALDASGNPVGYPGAVPASAAATLHSLALPIAGLREDQSTPLAGSLSVAEGDSVVGADSSVYEALAATFSTGPALLTETPVGTFRAAEKSAFTP